MPASDDDKIWAEYAKGVRRAATKKPVVKKPTLSKKICAVNLSAIQSEVPKEICAKGSPSREADGTPGSRHAADRLGVTSKFDYRTERKLRAGHIPIEARLDLHGMTQKEAHAALAEFVAAQAKTDARHLLVITGKGRGGNGVLKSNLLGWLENLPDSGRILALRPAAIKHGGTGAFYVILRRKG